LAGEGKQPVGESQYPNVRSSWKQLAIEVGFSPKDMEDLGREKLIVSDEPAKQVFSPYLEGSLPVFITSDSLLNAFHVLFEESLVRLERTNARLLPGILLHIWSSLDAAVQRCKGRPELVAAAKQRAQTVIAIALSLVGKPVPIADPSLDRIVKAETERVVAATATDKPAWLGPLDNSFAGLDYGRFKPRGFYAKEPLLQGYFRSLRWLQAIPFRVERDDELLSIYLLGACLNHSEIHRGQLRQPVVEAFFDAYRELLGQQDDWDVTMAARRSNVYPPPEVNLSEQSNALAKFREWLQEEARRQGHSPQINDQLRFYPNDLRAKPELGLRIVAAHRMPDSVLFQRTTDQRRLTRSFPNGLEVAAALGSGFASAKLDGKGRAFLLNTIEEAKRLFKGESFYCEYLGCLSSLLAPPERDGPAFLTAEAWRIKQCQTVLAGWAQMRHAWALQAKETISYLGIVESPSGFVEPVPEFYSRMAALIAGVRDLFRSRGAFSPDPTAQAASLRNMARLLVEKGFTKEGIGAMKRLSGSDEHDAGVAFEFLLWFSSALPEKTSEIAEGVKKIESLAEKLERGATVDSETLEILKQVEMDLEPLWQALELLTRRLEALAHKQLRQATFSDEENRFLRNYGKQLAGVMLYGGNSYLSPRDDAPRIVDVFTNSTEGRHLLAGIGCPRLLYVLYPWRGKEVFCRGAVMPYYEFTHNRRLTDAEWKGLLGSASAPPAPSWLKPIQVAKPVTPPKREKD